LPWSPLRLHLATPAASMRLIVPMAGPRMRMLKCTVVTSRPDQAQMEPSYESVHRLPWAHGDEASA
jgi:hypothetical protein